LEGTEAADQFETMDSAESPERTGAKREKFVVSKAGEAQATKMPDEGSLSALLGTGKVRTTGVTGGST
jgi:hypothetical protein